MPLADAFGVSLAGGVAGWAPVVDGAPAPDGVWPAPQAATSSMVADADPIARNHDFVVATLVLLASTDHRVRVSIDVGHHSGVSLTTDDDVTRWLRPIKPGWVSPRANR